MSDPALACAPGSVGHKWWLARRARGPIDSFRGLAALALMAHFTMHLTETVPLVAGSGLYDVGTAYENPLWPWHLDGLPPVALECVFGAAILLAALTGIGIAARPAATALFVISVATYRAIFPIADHSDFLANVTTLFLAFMAPGRTSTSFGQRPTGKVPGLAVTIFLVAVSSYYLSGQVAGGAETDDARRAAAIARFIPIAFVLPLPGLRWIGVGAQTLVHGYLLAATHGVLANVVLAATGLLFWGEPNEGSRGWTIDAGAVVGALVLILVVVGAVAPLGAGTPAVRRAARVVSDLGLVRPMPASDRGAARSMAVVDRANGSRNALDGGRRWQRLVDRVAADASPVRLALATPVARRYCRERGYWGFVGTLVWSTGGTDHDVFDFECNTGGDLSRIR